MVLLTTNGYTKRVFGTTLRTRGLGAFPGRVITKPKGFGLGVWGFKVETIKTHKSI